MPSSNNIPHIYSPKGEFVAAADWNALLAREYEVELLNTTNDSPFTADFTLVNFAINADSGDFTFNLPALSTCIHPNYTNFLVRYRITNLVTSLNNIEVTPNGSDLLRGVNQSATLNAGETIDIASLPGGWQ